MSKFRGSGKWMPDGPARTNTESSIRGRISAPIIADNDDFLARLPGVGVAAPLERDSLEIQLQLRSSTGSGNILQPDRIVSPRDSSPPPQPSHEPPPPPNLPNTQRTSAAYNPSDSNDGMAQRKKPSLGSVFRKIFGTKKRKDSSISNGGTPGAGPFRAGQHRSDPSALNRTPTDTSPAPKRSVSMPINEFNLALRSHSTVIQDGLLHDGINREPTQADGRTRPRRATTPSRLWAPNKSPGYVDWTGLSPRPASTHGRESGLISETEAEAAVGIAVTSGSHPNRRSRSLGELRGGTPANITVRRRSDEIKYWRESYDMGMLSPVSSNKAEAEEPIQLEHPEMPHDARQEQPQPFNFGPMGEMAGMKITQAASLESRVQRLEDHVLQMERAMCQMHRGTSGDPMVFQNSPKRDSKRDRSLSTGRSRTDHSQNPFPNRPQYRELQPPFDLGPHGSQKRSSSYGSSRPSTISTEDSYHASFDTFSRSTSDERTPAHTSQRVGRPLSISTTIRGVPSSSPATSKDSHLTGEHYTVLTNMILAEQAARQNLEATVHALRQGLAELRSAGRRGAYQTPESEHLAEATNGNKNGSRGEFSTFEQDDSSDDDHHEGRYAHEHDDSFQTPNEEHQHGTFAADGIFGHVQHANKSGENMKSTPRTLSLSQMTLGKGVQVQVQSS